MNKELEALQEVRQQLTYYKEYAKEKLPTKAEQIDASCEEELNLIETTLKDLQEENKLLRENVENLDENYFDTWYACERLKKNSNYALMFVDGVYCLVDTKDNKFDVIDKYRVNSKGIIDNGTQKKLLVLELIKEIIPIQEEDFFYDKETDIYFFIGHKVSKEQYDFLKEVLL